MQTVKSRDGLVAPLLQMTLYDGGRVQIDKRRLEAALMTGIEYEALVAMTDGTYDLLGSLIQLLSKVRLSTVDRLPMIDGPRRAQ